MKKEISSPVPFTSLIMAYYRYQETISNNPLFKDQFAEILMGNIIDYVEHHKYSTGNRDYAIIRTFFIDKQIIENWVRTEVETQIVLLGAGLDTRAYRLEKLAKKSVSIYEIDFENVLNYKTLKLNDFKPFCEVVRVGLDLVKESWPEKLLQTQFNPKLRTLWILEGLAYYIDLQTFEKLLKNLSNYSPIKSEIFVDVCVPALAELKFGPFTNNFKWGIEPNEIKTLFESNGWDIDFSFADNHNLGRDVGQRGLLFVSGLNNKQFQVKISNTGSEEKELLTIEAFTKIRRDISKLVVLAEKNPRLVVSEYISFMMVSKPFVRLLVEKLDPNTIGQLAPRILRDPLSIDLQNEMMSMEEIQAHIIGYLESILLVILLFLEQIPVWEFKNTKEFQNFLEKKRINRFNSLKFLLERILIFIKIIQGST